LRAITILYYYDLLGLAIARFVVFRFLIQTFARFVVFRFLVQTFYIPINGFPGDPPKRSLASGYEFASTDEITDGALAHREEACGLRYRDKPGRLYDRHESSPWINFGIAMPTWRLLDAKLRLHFRALWRSGA
jgi:hypothetical protein